jgi:hypothetical protein
LLRPGRQPVRDDGLDIFYRHVVSVLSQDVNTLVAVSETGEIKLIRLADEWVKQIQPPKLHWEHAGACRLSDSNDIVCWGRSISNACTSDVYVVCADGRIEKVFNTRNLVGAVACTPVGPMIHIGVDEEVITYTRRNTSWEPVMRRKERVSHLAALGADHIVVMPTERNWLEIWSTDDLLRTVAVCYMPISVRCISTKNDFILLGTNDGRHVLLTAHHKGI